MKNKIEGYWWSNKEENKDYPKAIHSDIEFEGKAIVLEALNKLEHLIKTHKKGNLIHYKGFSECRCCKILKGSREFEYKSWIWPEGLSHYINEHNIKPSAEFLDEVLGLKPQEIS
jgi:hypothetical protein